VIHPSILPSWLDFPPPPHAPRHHIPTISAHVIVVPPLTDNVKSIDSGPRFSFPQQVHPVPLDVLPSPLSSCLRKQEIVQNDPANHSSSCYQRWRCCHPKARSVCQPHGSLIFHGLLPMQSFSGEKPDIDCIWQDGKLDFSPG
jgi:hypothetical protein